MTRPRSFTLGTVCKLLLGLAVLPLAFTGQAAAVSDEKFQNDGDPSVGIETTDMGGSARPPGSSVSGGGTSGGGGVPQLTCDCADPDGY
jgi:hypothetical protein